MRFENRAVTARLLATRLERYRGQRPVVLGVPRGAVPMARIIADTLDGDLDVVLVRKLRAPGQPELAIGAVDEGGTVVEGGLLPRAGAGHWEPTRHTTIRRSWANCANLRPLRT